MTALELLAKVGEFRGHCARVDAPKPWILYVTGHAVEDALKVLKDIPGWASKDKVEYKWVTPEEGKKGPEIKGLFGVMDDVYVVDLMAR